MSWFVILEQQNRRPHRPIKDRSNPIEILNDKECVQRFRLDKRGISFVCNLIEEDIMHTTERNNALPTIIQVCVALRFFAQGRVRFS